MYTAVSGARNRRDDEETDFARRRGYVAHQTSCELKCGERSSFDVDQAAFTGCVSWVSRRHPWDTTEQICVVLIVSSRFRCCKSPPEGNRVQEQGISSLLGGNPRLLDQIPAVEQRRRRRFNCATFTSPQQTWGAGKHHEFFPTNTTAALRYTHAQ
jgi:hypothetical protein